MSNPNTIVEPNLQLAGKEKRPRLELGRGLDVGTANLVAAVQDELGRILVKSDRNAFLEVPTEAAVNRDMLTRLGVPYVAFQGRLYVLGEASFNLANLLGNEVRRPMYNGFLAANEKDAIPMMRFILERLLGEPTKEREDVYFCVPAPSVDRDNDVVYHQGVVSGLVEKLGFTPHAINEGHAIIYSELGKENFTGIAVSCGGGMFNVCVAYKTIPAVTFSVSRGGDWIDEHVARVMGISRPRATALKENEAVDLMRAKTREEEAIVLYYRNLIQYVLANLRQRFESSRDIPQFTDPVEVVVAGGTSKVKGFPEIFGQELEKAKLGIPIKGIRRAGDPMTSVARGCLIAAQLHVS